MTAIVPRPDYRVTLDGVDLSPKIRPRLLSLTITSKREEADQLDLALSDEDGLVALPREGARLAVEIGWAGGLGVVAGLVSKGTFVVDDIGHSGTPDVVTIRARSADFTKTSELRNRRAQAWHGTTLGAIVREIAGRMKLTPRISADLAAVALASVHQSRESDAALLRRLGREHDAVATIKAGRLIFARIGATVTTSGKALPSFTFRRRDGDRHDYQRKGREEVTGVTASYHDVAKAKTVKMVAGQEKGAKHLSRVYASKASAKRAADSAMSRAKRAPATLSVTAALGCPTVYVEQHVTVSGFKPDIDATRWIAAGVTQTIDGSGGFTTQLELEAAS